MNRTIVWAVAKTTFREFWRKPEAVFWTYGFPVLMAVVLGFAFQPKAPAPVPVVVVEGADTAALQQALQASPRLHVEVLAAAAADAALARGRVALLARGTPQVPVLRADPTRPDAETARMLVERALRDHTDGPGSITPQVEVEARPGSRYIDFLIPGLIGLNLLGAGLWGVGFNLVQMRTQSLLRRLLVTPMGRGDFLLGFLLSRMVLVLPESFAIVLLGMLWGVPFRGSIAAAAVLMLVGAMAFSGLGILVASRPKTIEGVAGLMNLCLLPMWLLGGSFFSNERMPGWLGWIADALPLTQFNNGLRDVMLEPLGFAAVAGPLGYLSGFTVVCFAIALKLFRWT